MDDPHVKEIMHTRDPQSDPPCQRVREEPASYSQRENYSLSGKPNQVRGALPHLRSERFREAVVELAHAGAIKGRYWEVRRDGTIV